MQTYRTGFVRIRCICLCEHNHIIFIYRAVLNYFQYFLCFANTINLFWRWRQNRMIWKPFLHISVWSKQDVSVWTCQSRRSVFDTSYTSAVYMDTCAVNIPAIVGHRQNKAVVSKSWRFRIYTYMCCFDNRLSYRVSNKHITRDRGSDCKNTKTDYVYVRYFGVPKVYSIIYLDELRQLA